MDGLQDNASIGLYAGFLQTRSRPNPFHDCECQEPFQDSDPFVVDVETGDRAERLLGPLPSFVESHSLPSQSLDKASLLQHIALWKDSLLLLDISHHRRPHLLFYLAAAHYLLFYRTEQREDLDTAVDTYRRALRMMVSEDPYRVYALAHAGQAFRDRYGISANIHDIYRAVHALAVARHLCHMDHPLRGYIWHWLWHGLKSIVLGLIEIFQRLPLESLIFLGNAVVFARQASEL
jgi:hypothetical protein